MGMLADFAKLNTEIESYSRSLEKAYAAAVKQSQAMDAIERSAKAAALAMVDAGNKAEAGATKMEQVSAGGFSSGTLGDGQITGWSSGPENTGSLNNVIDAFKNGTSDFNATVKIINKLIEDNKKQMAYESGNTADLEGRLAETKARLEALKAEFGNSKRYTASNDWNILRNIESTLSLSRKSYEKYAAFEKKLETSITSLDGLNLEQDAIAADWKNAITDFSQRVNSNDIKGASNVDEVRLEALAKKLMEAMLSGANAKTYTIQLNGNDIRTIDDPTDLIKLIEELSRSKRSSI